MKIKDYFEFLFRLVSFGSYKQIINSLAEIFNYQNMKIKDYFEFLFRLVSFGSYKQIINSLAEIFNYQYLG